jgi:hypothetical protein
LALLTNCDAADRTGPRTSRFAEEAYWDLRIAEKLLAGLDLGTCDHDDEVFYTGRRVLYLLQQASEKATKAYLVAYFRIWLD